MSGSANRTDEHRRRRRRRRRCAVPGPDANGANVCSREGREKIYDERSERGRGGLLRIRRLFRSSSILSEADGCVC